MATGLLMGASRGEAWLYSWSSRHFKLIERRPVRVAQHSTALHRGSRGRQVCRGGSNNSRCRISSINARQTRCPKTRQDKTRRLKRPRCRDLVDIGWALGMSSNGPAHVCLSASVIGARGILGVLLACPGRPGRLRPSAWRPLGVSSASWPASIWQTRIIGDKAKCSAEPACAPPRRWLLLPCPPRTLIVKRLQSRFVAKSTQGSEVAPESATMYHD